MKAWWSETRLNGTPLEAGTFCRVIDLEDGSHPIATYGRSQEEVLEKIERQNGNAQLALVSARRATAQPNPAAQAGLPSPGAAPPRRLSADEVMQHTTDLQNPGKAGEAIATLFEDATGIDLRQQAMDNFRRLALEWEDEHPEFYQHPGNRTLLGAHVGKKVNHQVSRITKEMLTQGFNELLASEQLFELPADQQQPPNTPSTFPAESQVPRTERPRRSAYSTGIPGNRLRAPQTAPPRTLKYTERQILAMPTEEYTRLWNSGDKDFRESVAAYEARQMAS